MIYQYDVSKKTTASRTESALSGKITAKDTGGGLASSSSEAPGFVDNRQGVPCRMMQGHNMGIRERAFEIDESESQ